MKLRTHLNHSKCGMTKIHVWKTQKVWGGVGNAMENKWKTKLRHAHTKAGKQITMKFQQFAINWDNKAQKANQSGPQMYSNFLPPSHRNNRTYASVTHTQRCPYLFLFLYFPWHFAWHFGEFRVQSHIYSLTHSFVFGWKSHFNNCKTTNLLQLETVMVTGAPEQMDMVLPANTKTLFIQPEL